MVCHLSAFICVYLRIHCLNSPHGEWQAHQAEDQRAAGEDDDASGEAARRERLAEEDHAPDHPEDRHEQRHRDRLHRPHVGDEAVVEDERERGGEDRQPQHREPRERGNRGERMRRGANGAKGASAAAAKRSVPAEVPSGLAPFRCTFVNTIV